MQDSTYHSFCYTSRGALAGTTILINFKDSKTKLLSLGEICISVVEHLLMVRWVIGSITHGGPIELFHIPYKRTLTANWKV